VGVAGRGSGRDSDADAAFDAFAVSAWQRLRWTAYLLVGDAHLAEDLAQTALARTYVAWRRIRADGDGDAMAYARRVLVNANIDRLRRRRLTEVPFVATGDLDGGGTAAVPQDAVVDRDQLVRLIGGLSARERRIIVLKYLYDLSDPAVGEELGISVGTVKSTASRALAKLRVAQGVAEPTTSGKA
jgi:RNA polymerase sigma-70 factor (sigma-E family)